MYERVLRLVPLICTHAGMMGRDANPGRDVLKNSAVTSQLARVGQNTRTDPLSSIVSRTSTAM